MAPSDQRSRDQMRTYGRRTSVVFCKTQEAFGGLSNMAAGYPVMVNGVDIRTSEALYQACRFPHRPDVQRLIIAERSPMTAKMKSKPHRHDTRPDWDAVRVGIMRWCLRVKLAQNWRQFGELLLSTGERPIVEESRKDDYWGAKVVDPGTLVGMNVLGRLLMELREELKSATGEQLQHVEPPRIPDFQLYGQPVGVIARDGVPAREPDMSRHPLLDIANIRETPAAANMAASPPPVVTVAAAPELKPTMKEGSDGVIPKECKRLAEVDFPIAIVSKHSAREKSIRHGHPSTLHLWWARRPLAACRAMLMALLLPDPCDATCPSDFKQSARRLLLQHPMRPTRWEMDIKTDDGLRHVLLQFIGDFADWANAANSAYLKAARELVRAAHPEGLPLVVDPFSGGGSIPLEALRLGCDALATDLNPVACLILKALLEDIPRHGPDLADELERLGSHIKTVADKTLTEFYPPDPDGARPIAYLWARTVRCESPACGAEIPLVRSFWLCKKANRLKALRHEIIRPQRGVPRVEFEVYSPLRESDVAPGTVSRAKATCPCCSVTLSPERVRAQLSEQRGGADAIFDERGKRTGGARLMAVVTLRPGEPGRHYRVSTNRDYEAVWNAQQQLARILKAWERAGKPGLCPVPNEPLPWKHGHRSIQSPRVYGMRTWSDYFAARQLLSLSRLASVISDTRAEGDKVGIQEMAALLLSKFAELSCANCRWEPVAECPRSIFTRHDLPATWDFAEGVPLSSSSGGFEQTLENVIGAIKRVGSNWAIGQVQQADARRSSLPTGSASAWFTDPPYYDAVAYADLSDFFFVWLKRAMPGHAMLVDPFDAQNPLVPKRQELTVTTAPSETEAPKTSGDFERGVYESFAEGARVIDEAGIGCVVFAHKTTEGWEALLTGMLRAGWVIRTSWPVATEMAHRFNARDVAALATSVHLVCRPRAKDAPVGDWGDVLRELPPRVGEWMDRLQGEGIRGADLVFACIGPALEIFSRYTRVETAEGREVPLPEYLSKVWEVVGRTALQQVLGTAEASARNGATGALEEDARLTALFLWTLQATDTSGDGDEGEASEDDTTNDDEPDQEKSAGKKTKGFSLIYDVVRRFAQPLGIHLKEWEHRIIETDKGVVRLLPALERAEQLFGEDGASGVADRLERSGNAAGAATQGLLFPQPEEPPRVRGSGRRGRSDVPDESMRTRREATTLDRVHAAMLLQASGRANALRALLTAEVDRSPDFLRLANALSALYPAGSDEKRLVDAMLLAVPR